MAVTDLRINIASEFTGAAAFKKADNATARLNKNVKSLAGNLGLAFGGAQLARYAKDAVKAFAADDKAAQMLTKSLDNLGLGFQATQVRTFIADLEKTYGVVDDLLRPAFQKLLTTTGSVAQSQKLLQTALNLSAASGKDVESVAADLSKAFVGQTRSLAKYGLGLSQAELKAMSFEEVQSRINTLFGGQALLAVNTYSGSIDKLTVAANNAKEIIGKGLVDAIKSLSSGGTGGIDDATKNIEKMATVFSKLIVYGTRFNKVLFNMHRGLSGFKQIAADISERSKSDPFAAWGGGSVEAIRANAMAQFYAAKKVTDAKKIADTKAATAAKKLSAQQIKAAKDLASLNKAGVMFDMDKIQIIAALKGKISDDERMRLELQLALETDNAEKASQLTYQLAKSQGLTESLARTLANLPAAKNPFASWEAYLDSIAEKARKIANMPVNAGAGAGAGVTSAIPSFADSTKVLLEAQAAELEALRVLNLLGIGNRPEMIAPASSEQRSFQSLSAAPIVIQIDGKTIATALQNESLSGVNPTVNRFAFGGFGY